jgi:hypothetical protein
MNCDNNTFVRQRIGIWCQRHTTACSGNCKKCGFVIFLKSKISSINTILESSLALWRMGASCPSQVIGGEPVLVQTIPSIMWATPTTKQLSNVLAGLGQLMGTILYRKMAQTSRGVANARAPMGKLTGCGQNLQMTVKTSP